MTFPKVNTSIVLRILLKAGVDICFCPNCNNEKYNTYRNITKTRPPTKYQFPHKTIFDRLGDLFCYSFNRVPDLNVFYMA